MVLQILFIGSNELTNVFLNRVHVFSTFITTYLRKLCFIVLLCYQIIHYTRFFDGVLQSFVFSSLLKFIKDEKYHLLTMKCSSLPLRDLGAKEDNRNPNNKSSSTIMYLPATAALSTYSLRLKIQ